MTSSYRGRVHTEALGICQCLTYRDVRQAITWLHTAFGLQGQALAPPGTAGEPRVPSARSDGCSAKPGPAGPVEEGERVLTAHR
jgi:hypothetical protein